MRRLGRGLALALACAALCALAAPEARAQDGAAHCAWLQIKATGKGYEIDDTLDALGKKRSPKAVCYAQLVHFPSDAEHPFGSYSAPLVCQVDAANWTMTNATEGMVLTVLRNGDAIADDDYLTFRAASGDVIQGYALHVLDVKTDSETGALKKASWKTLSGQLIDGSTWFDTPSTVFGAYVAKGKTIPATKVPPAARAVLASGVCPSVPE